MKISQELRPLLESGRTNNRRTNQDQQPFQFVFEKQQEKLQTEIFKRLITDIDMQGEKLAQLQTARELQQYKRLVHRFVKEAVEFGMDLKQSRSWNHQGKMSMLTTVETIDAHLLDLTEAVLQKGKSSLDLLEKVGEIKGLLINLYM